MNFDIWDALIIGFYLGVGVGWWFNRKPPVIVVDKSVLANVTTQMAMNWAEIRGLTWMPKGAVFDPNKVVKK